MIDWSLKIFEWQVDDRAESAEERDCKNFNL